MVVTGWNVAMNNKFRTTLLGRLSLLRHGSFLGRLNIATRSLIQKQCSKFSSALLLGSTAAGMAFACQFNDDVASCQSVPGASFIADAAEIASPAVVNILADVRGAFMIGKLLWKNDHPSSTNNDQRLGMLCFFVHEGAL